MTNPTAAMLVIGDEILSGRTRDANMHYLAGQLAEAGITLAVSPSHAVSLFGITLICAGFSVGFGVAMSQALGPFSLRAGVASSTLGIAQVCGSSLWIWLAAVVGIGAWNMLIGILIACSIVSLLLIMFVAPGRPVAAHEEIHHHA